MKVYNLTLIFIFCTFSLAAQNITSKDDIRQSLKEITSDSVKIDTLYKLGLTSFLRGKKTAQLYFEEGLTLIENQKNTEQYTERKLRFLSRLGGVYREKGDYDIAISNYIASQKLAYKLKDTFLVSELHHNIGKAFLDKGDYKKAFQYIKGAIILKKKYSNPSSIGSSYLTLGVLFRKSNQIDSALYYYDKANTIYKSIDNISQQMRIKGNMAVIYREQKQYDKSIALYHETINYHKGKENLSRLSRAYRNISYSYSGKNKYAIAIKHLDSSLQIAKEQNLKRQMMAIYRGRSIVYEKMKRFENALNDSKMYKRYSDSIFNNEKSQHILEMEYEHKFQIEQMKNAQSQKKHKDRMVFVRKKKSIYFALFLLTLVSGVVITWLIKKNNKQQLQLVSNKLKEEKIEKLQTELALKNREGELKKVAIESSVRQEILAQILDDIQKIIGLKDEQKRKTALKSLSALLLSENEQQTATTNIQTYLDQVNLDFKVSLDTHFSILKQKEKDLLSLMKLGLNANDIKTIQNTTLASVKSSRYRIRKKLGLNSDEDIVAYIENFKKPLS